jgi:dienelactone hydrolase/putative intracellular protease/amidase
MTDIYQNRDGGTHTRLLDADGVRREDRRMSKHVLIVLTSHATLGDTGRGTGFYVSEAAEPWEVFTEAGYEVDLVSVAGGEPPRDGEDPADPTQRRFLADADVARQLADTPTTGAVDVSRYDAVLFAGGHGAMWDFPDNATLGGLARVIYENGGVVAAVCHGPAALVGATLSDGSRLVDGRRIAAFTNGEEAAVGLTDVVPFLLSDRLRDQGAELVPAGTFAANVIRDGRLVTGQNPASARGVAEVVVAALSTAHERVEIAVGPDVMGAYVARPVTPGTYPGVIVAHQLFGVTPDVRAIADRIAGLGYVAIAPDFYHRSEPGAELPVTDEGRARGFALMNELSRDGVLADVRAARAYLRGRGDATGQVGMVGVSMGGHLAYYAATQLDLAVAVVLYAGWLTGTDMPVSRPEPTLELTPGITGRLLFIVGDRDHVIDEKQRTAIADRLTAEGVRHEVVVIPGAPHAFLSEGTASYHAAAAVVAWRRVEEVLAGELG